MPRNPEHEPIYQAFQEFMERCLIDDRSLLWPDEEIWTLERVLELKKRLIIDNAISGTGQSYNDRLLFQMKGADRQLWQLLADAYFVYYLPPISKSVKAETKKKNISWVAQQAGVSLPDASDAWQALDGGFAATGTRYNFRYLQVWFLILLAQVVKEAQDRSAKLNSAEALRLTVDEVLAISPSADRAPEMGRAILYMAWPEVSDTWLSGRKPTEGNTKDGGSSDGGGGGSSKEVEKKDLTDANTVLKALQQTRNVILYGPPGTGKTFIARKVAEEWTKPVQVLETPEARSAQMVQGLAFYDILALAMFLIAPQGSYPVSELLEHPLVRARFQLAPVQHPENSIWANLQRHTVADSKTVKVTNRWEPFLFDKGADSRWHLTDEGRAYVQQTLRGSVETWRKPGLPEERAFPGYTWVTFHQNYTYEDFVEGLRPVISDEMQSGVSYEIKLGLFRQICLAAQNDPGNRYVLVIDEINRGNIAKILGELLTLLEDDKRAGMENALKVKLPYSQQEFSVPPNLYIIGTMNTTDRSIALLDVALRRRFAFVELMPRPELLTASVESNGASVPLRPLLERLNTVIRRDLGRDHQLGHSYFLRAQKPPEAERLAVLEFVWNHQVLPLLREYYHNQPEQLAELLKPSANDNGDVADAAEGDDLLTALAQIAGTL